jgi:AcrR family transcriptional regulator
MAAARRKTTRERAALTPERIRERALRLIDDDGLEGFSTRKLGAALGCEAMAIYWYYPSKDALLDAVVEELISRLPIEPAEEGDWIGALRNLAHAYRRLAHQHPKAFPLLATRRFATEGTYRFLEGIFSLAREAGLDDRSTARFFRLVSSYIAGAALDELAGPRHPEMAKSLAGARTAFPRVEAVFSWLAPEHDDETFSFGLELLLDALQKAPRKAGPTKKKKGS